MFNRIAAAGAPPDARAPDGARGVLGFIGLLGTGDTVQPLTRRASPSSTRRSSRRRTCRTRCPSTCTTLRPLQDDGDAQPPRRLLMEVNNEAASR